jgi:hypothetical protein
MVNFRCADSSRLDQDGSPLVQSDSLVLSVGKLRSVTKDERTRNREMKDEDERQRRKTGEI